MDKQKQKEHAYKTLIGQIESLEKQDQDARTKELLEQAKENVKKAKSNEFPKLKIIAEDRVSYNHSIESDGYDVWVKIEFNMFNNDYLDLAECLRNRDPFSIVVKEREHDKT